MYAIYESYVTRESNNLGAILAGGTSINASINNSPGRQGGTLSSGVKPTTDQHLTNGDLGQSNEEIKIPKQLNKILKSLTTCAHKADYDQMLIDCMYLNKALKKLMEK